MKRSYLVIGGAAIILIAVLLVILGRHEDSPKKQADAATARDVTGKVVAGSDRASDDTSGPPIAPGEADPAGTLLLEGQVLGDDDQPAAKAEVWVSSTPPRKAITEDDGTFQFDKLLPREYTLHAHAGDAVGGPVTVRLGPNMDPVVVRLRDGSSLQVHVTAEADGKPVAGASVELREMGAQPATTDAEGKASFRGLGAGWTVVVVKASGFAEASTAATIGSPGSMQDVSIALRKGAGLSGKVVDEAGAPVPHAMVALSDAGSVFDLEQPFATSGDDGTFSFPVVGAGSYKVTARDGTHAPGTSDLVTVDGVSAKTDVIVTMKAGATIHGHVVTKDKRPAPYAQVEVAAKSDGGVGMTPGFAGPAGHATADAQGVFDLRGLPRAKVRVHAENDEAGSQIVDVDLTTETSVADLELVLDVDGTIAGVVVDAKGEPVAEAQVSAITDFMGADDAPKMEDLQFAGMTSAVTDGGGAFRLHGLPTGAYRLWASRTAVAQLLYQTEGTTAKTGDTNVRIVLPEPGSLAGHVALSSGDPPKHAIVNVGNMPATPIVDGEISIRDLPAGKYDLKIRGPEFEELTRRDVEIKEGATTDLGTITVQKGRQLAGKVVDAAGNPVVGARVMAGTMLISQGKGGGFDPAIEEQMGLKSATSGDDGSFLILGAPKKGGSVMADDSDRGRSDALAFAGGDGDVTGVTLVLHGFGSISGVVTMQGQPLGGVAVTDSSKGSSGQMIVVTTGDDGRFVIDKTPEGDHRLSADKVENMQVTSAGVDVHVEAGKKAEITIDIPVGTISLTVTVKGKGGAKIDAAQVFLFRGTVVAQNAKQITDGFLSGNVAGMKVWFGGPQAPVFDKLVPGAYSVCTLPISGNIADPQYQRRLQEHADDLAVYCASVPVNASPDQQAYTAVVPPMTPLPAD